MSAHDRMTDRRRLLIGLGGASGALVAGLAEARAAENVAAAPADRIEDQRQPVYGPHQAGIVTPRPAAGMVASFDVLAATPAELTRLFKALTARITFLTQGGMPPALDPKLPPADSGLLGPVVYPDNLTITVSVGASLFDDRFGLADKKPRHLTDMIEFPNDALQPALCHGDLALQICSNTPDTNIHALRDILKNLPDLLLLRWKQEGGVPVVPPKPGVPPESARNMLGFRDGSANPSASDEELMNSLVWTGAANGEPQWTNGGTYQVIRIIRTTVERWDRTPLGEQERIIGRKKISGAPFDGKTERDVPDYAADPDGKLTARDAHIRLANPRSLATDENRILRRPFNYSNGLTKSGQLEMGLLFIAYQSDLQKGFVTVQRRLNGEPLEEYIKPVGGGFFFALPGMTGADDFLGRSLLAGNGNI